MTTEPHISFDRREGLASFLGALASMAPAVLLVVWFMLGEIYFPPEDPENDGYIRGFASIVGFLPLMFIVNFMYYIFIGISKDIELKTTCKISVVLSIFSGVGFGSLFKEFNDFVTPLLVGGFITLFFSISLCVGCWAWHRTLKKHNKLSQQDAVNRASA
jgi:hypothetical protein